MGRVRRGANGWTGLGRLITQRSEVQILPPLQRIALWRRPFPYGRGLRRLKTCSNGCSNRRLGSGLAAVRDRDAVRRVGRGETGHVARDWDRWVPGPVVACIAWRAIDCGRESRGRMLPVTVLVAHGGRAVVTRTSGRGSNDRATGRVLLHITPITRVGGCVGAAIGSVSEPGIRRDARASLSVGALSVAQDRSNGASQAGSSDLRLQPQ
jgi:hypothetical protein